MSGILFSFVRVTKIWKISNCIWNYWLENWKTECWSRFIVIRDSFIEVKYYTIHNIWKEIGKLYFMIIGVDIARKGIASDHDFIQDMDCLIYYVFCI